MLTNDDDIYILRKCKQTDSQGTRNVVVSQNAACWAKTSRRGIIRAPNFAFFCYEYGFLIILWRYASTLFQNRTQTSANFCNTCLPNWLAEALGPTLPFGELGIVSQQALCTVWCVRAVTIHWFGIPWLYRVNPWICFSAWGHGEWCRPYVDDGDQSRSARILPRSRFPPSRAHIFGIIRSVSLYPQTRRICRVNHKSRRTTKVKNVTQPGAFREHSVNIQWTFREHSVNIQWTFSEHSVNISDHSVNNQAHAVS